MRPAAAAIAGAVLIALAAPAHAATPAETARWRQQSAAVTIIRDEWGIAHVHGRTDADAVFGAIYAQAEDDFSRIEANYLDALGRRAEADGESALWSDLRQRLFVDPAALQADYAKSPAWLKALMDAWADGLNAYLADHPQVKPRVLTRFEPWMALSFTEGSIGGDIEQVSLKGLQAFYDRPGAPADDVAIEEPARYREPTGSNGIAIAPKNTRDGHALLLINPHTSFFFRSELQMTSDQGLDAYGAATWGQFFLYQGFNRHLGWMHTSAYIDAVDEFAETVRRKDGRLVYRYGPQERPVTASSLALSYRTTAGTMATRLFTVYRTHHGPVVRKTSDGRWISVALMNTPVAALSQSYLRTKAADYSSYLKVALTYAANSSNDTIFADDKGEIAFLAPQFIPKRDDSFDYSEPVDGADPNTDWKGLTPFAETAHVVDPPNGWVKNTNDWAYSVAGPYSPKASLYPRYMDSVGENPRGVHAEHLLTGRRDWTLEGLTRAAFDPWLPEFAVLVPRLTSAYDALLTSDPRKAKLKAQVAALRAWDDRWSAASTQTSLAVFWGETLWACEAPRAKSAKANVYDWLASRTSGETLLDALQDASDQLTRDWGDWRVAWGEINRFQRLDDAIATHVSDSQPSIPIPFTSSRWGSLASFGAKPYPGTRRWYGSSGNSFVAVVEFGRKVRALAVTAGGESGDPSSPHFNDEAQRYASGRLRPVYFYPEDVAAHAVKRYSPGG